MLKIKDLTVKTEDKDILKNVTLEVAKNEVHVIMGPNGSGKSTLAQTVMGNPSYEVQKGAIELEGNDITKLQPQERASRGLFLSFQHPSEISGVTVSSYLRTIYNKNHEKQLSVPEFRKLLEEKVTLLQFPEELLTRYLNENFSGGEKKKLEILQLMLIEPKIAILDEIDSGLDVDALGIITKALVEMKNATGMSILLITHYTRILKFIEPDKVHVMKNGTITRSGNKELAEELEEKGFGNE